MATILYNTDTQQVIGQFDPCYLVNGKPGLVELPAVELDVKNSPQPIPQEGFSYISEYVVDLKNKEYIQQWKLIELSPPLLEISQEEVLRLALRKLDGETLTEEEQSIIDIYKENPNTTEL